MAFIWSDYQKAIFNDIANGITHTLVVARAGSSKTTTIVEGAKYIPKNKTAIMCAFNKTIQEELKKKLPSYVTCKTNHSIGFAAVKKRWPAITLDQDKVSKIIDNLLPKSADKYDLSDSLQRVVSLCKNSLNDSPTHIQNIIDNFSIDICSLTSAKFIHYTTKILSLAKNDTKTIDFDDMIWFPIIYNINPGKYDFVFVDEAQDLSQAQILLTLNCCKKPNGRVIAVGDPKQSIYSWRTAEFDSFALLKKLLKGIELPLPITYRCPIRVVNLVQRVVPDIKPRDNAPLGDIYHINFNEFYKNLSAGVLVLSRTNAPLIKHCMKLIKSGIKANILGRDVGSGLIYLIKKSKKSKIKDFLKWLDKWFKKEIDNASGKKNRIEFITDKYESLINFCEDMESVEELISSIDGLFKEQKTENIILFSTVHRSKGLEAEKVFVLHDTLMSNGDGTGGEEDNIYYVAMTRSKSKLYLVSKNN